MVLSLILILGLFTYLILQRTVAPVTRTPLWLLWLVMMTPAILWTGWFLIYGQEKPMPVGLKLAPFLIYPCFYWLVAWGKPREQRSEPDNQSDVQPLAESSPEDNEPTPPLRPITSAEEAQLKECFPWSVYFLQNLEYRPQAVICWGHLRTNPDEAYRTVEVNIQRIFGRRFLLAFRENFTGKPFFILVENPYKNLDNGEDEGSFYKPFLAGALFFISLITTTLVGAEMAGGIGKSKLLTMDIFLRGLPYALALLSIFGVYAVARFLVARHYQIRSTLPYFIPIPFFLGTLGAFISIRSPIPHRKALFDLSVSGPLLSLLISLPLLVWGLFHSQVVNLQPDIVGLFDFNAINPRFSLLFGLLSKLILGSGLGANQGVDLHPVGVAGYVGLVVTAFYLMPVGQLDGGHIVHAMFGFKTAATIGQVSRLLLLILAVFEREFLLLALLLFLIPVRNDSALNDVSELDNRRDFLGLVALALLLLIILPVPKVILSWLNFL